MNKERSQAFGAVAADYDRLRPAPPDEAVQWLLGEHRWGAALDLAAGTGGVARVLARHVSSVIAVEPDPRMRAVLTERSPQVTVLAGTGEAIPLPEASVDVVAVSSAWHWLDPDRAVDEIARVLRADGVLGVLWNSLDTTVSWVAEFAAFRSSASDRTRSRRREVTLPAGAPFSSPERATFPWRRSMSRDDLVDLLTTYSGVITAAPEQRQDKLRAAQRYLHDLGHAEGHSTMDVPFRTVCWRARRLRTPTDT